MLDSRGEDSQGGVLIAPMSNNIIKYKYVKSQYFKNRVIMHLEAFATEDFV